MSLNSLRKHNYILASQSPRRKKLLKSIGLKFKVISPNIEEIPLKGEKPHIYTKRVARDKARQVALKSKDSIIIAADTTVVINNKILNKPKDSRDAVRMLKMLSNKTHTVITAVCVINQKNNREICSSEKTKVTFRKLKDDEISEYVKSGACMDKAGSYGIQEDFGAVFVRKVSGCYYNVVGLPLAMTYQILKEITS